jgi:hypothetical protein
VKKLLLNACLMPGKFQYCTQYRADRISAFLDAKDWFLKCVHLKLLILKCLLLILVENFI